MSYWIEGWVEVTPFRTEEQNEDYSWSSLLNIGELPSE